jgi:hypothetical protein
MDETSLSFSIQRARIDCACLMTTGSTSTDSSERSERRESVVAHPLQCVITPLAIGRLIRVYHSGSGAGYRSLRRRARNLSMY